MTDWFRIEANESFEDLLDFREHERLLQRTINKAGSKVKTAITKEIRRRYFIKLSRLNEFLFVTKAKTNKLSFAINSRKYAGGKILGLSMIRDFKAKENKRKGKRSQGVSAKIYKGRAKTTVKRGFIIDVKGNSVSLKRIGPGKKDITKILAPAVADLLKADWAVNVGNKVWKRQVPIIYDRELAHMVKTKIRKRVLK